MIAGRGSKVKREKVALTDGTNKKGAAFAAPFGCWIVA